MHRSRTATAVERAPSPLGSFPDAFRHWWIAAMFSLGAFVLSLAVFCVVRCARRLCDADVEGNGALRNGSGLTESLVADSPSTRVLLVSRAAAEPLKGGEQDSLQGVVEHSVVRSGAALTDDHASPRTDE